LKLLLEKDAKQKFTDNEGRTPLSWAAMNEHETAVKLLLEKSAELESMNNKD